MTFVDELIPIGQFAGLTWLSPKALRIYQAQGLLHPAWIDPRSGYRYYDPSQIAPAARISLLRRAGVPLAEIAAFLAAPTAERVHAWRDELDTEVAERRRLLDHIAKLTELMEVPTVTHPQAVALQRAIPVLASLDLDATQRFYAEKLGFDVVSRYPDYAISARDGVQVHFWLTDDADIPKATSCRVDVTGIETLYEQMKAVGVVHPNGPLREQPWGMKEFAVLDGDGNLITFGERVSSSPPG
jgi:DNA-binding transcriptional MerR regulator